MLSETLKRVAVIGAVLGVVTGARAQTTYGETFVELESTVCGSSPQILYHEAFGGIGLGSSVGGQDLDADGETASINDEDGDNDEVFETIVSALAGTTAGGTIHLSGRGIYRDDEDVSITDSITIRGFSDADVIIEPLECDTPLGTAFTVALGSGEVAVFENLTIRSFEVAVDASSSAGTIVFNNCTLVGNDKAVDISSASGTIVFNHCRIAENGTAIDASSFSATLILDDTTVERNTTALTGNISGELRLDGSRIVRNGDAIENFLVVRAVDSVISHNTVSSISNDNADWSFHRTTVADNAAGLSVIGGGSGSATVSISESRILRNGGSGVDIDQVVVDVRVHASEISENGAHGLEMSGRNGSTFSVSDSEIARNEDDGIHVRNTSPCGGLVDGFDGMVMDSRIVQNGEDGIDHGGTATGCSLPNFVQAVETGLLQNAISLNGAYGLNEFTSTSFFVCDLGQNAITFNAIGAENGTGGVCTGTGGATANQVYNP